MDDHVPTEIPGLQTYGVRSDCVTFLGSREAIQASGYVPAGTPFPGDRPNMRGSNWRTKSGRRWRITKGYYGELELRLTVFRTKNEARAFAAEERREHLVAERIALLAREVDAMPTEASHAVQEFRFLASEYVRSSASFILNSETVKLRGEDRSEIKEHLRALAEAIETAALEYDDTARSSKAAELRQLKTRRDDGSFNGFMSKLIVVAS